MGPLIGQAQMRPALLWQAESKKVTRHMRDCPKRGSEEGGRDSSAARNKNHLVDQPQPHIPETMASNNMVHIPPLNFLALSNYRFQSCIGQDHPVDQQHIPVAMPANNMVSIPLLTFLALSNHRDNIGGPRANNRVLSVGQILALSTKYPLDDTKSFTAIYTRDVEGLALYHVEESNDGATPKELLASLNKKNLLGARTSSSDEAIGPAIWWHGTDDDILVMAWVPASSSKCHRMRTTCEAFS